VRRDGQLIGIGPLLRQGEKMAFIGSSDVCDHMDFIARRGQEAAALSQLLDYLEAMDWNSIALQSLLPDSLALSHFAPLAEQRGYLVEKTQEDVNPQTMLPSSWEEYLSWLKKKDRHELRRKQRRLNHATPNFYTITEREKLPEALESFFELFKLSGEEKAAFMTEPMRSFFETMIDSLAEAGYIRLSFLEVSGVRGACALCFDYGDSFYLYNSGYDPAYASLSVGLLIKVFCLSEGITLGKKRFDFLRGDEPYKYHLGGQAVPIYRCLISRD
jgi:CelD/BcsL family acetyltransferase involved in cellulose biosynthesis